MRKIYSFLVLFFVSFVTYSQEDYCVTDISFKSGTISIFTSDGKIYTWGDNQFGQIGNGTTEFQGAPDYYLRPETPEFVSISHGHISSTGLTSDGKIYTWGTNLTGVLGDGTTIDNFIPTQVGTDTDWVKVVNTWVNNIALKSDGTLWGWGNNGNCALSSTPGIGGGLENYYPSPIQLSPDNDWVDIGAGAGRTFAIKSNGTLWARGRNTNGYGVGVPSTSGQCVNVLTQIGTDTDWKKVVPSNMGSFTLALKTDNTLWYWGRYSSPDIPVPIPTQVGVDTWKEVAAGSFHSVGIKSDGTLWQWGVGCYMMSQGINFLLDGPSEVPIQLGTDNNWVKVAAGACLVFALKDDNTVWAWGFNGDDINWSAGPFYGDSNTPTSLTPVLVFQCAKASVSEHELSNIILYPNPTADKIFWAQNIVIEKATVYDMNGKQVLFENITENSIDVSHLASGTYLIKLESQDKLIYNSKFVKN